MNNTMEIVRLGKNDVLIIEDEIQVVAQGEVVCSVDTGEFTIDESAILYPIEYEEACALHENGNTIFEVSEAFTGTWREM